MEIKTELSRTAMLLGGDAVERLTRARVAVFGLGGVGGALCEALAPPAPEPVPRWAQPSASKSAPKQKSLRGIFKGVTF